MTDDDGKAGGGSGGGLLPGTSYVAEEESYVLAANEVKIVANAPLTAIPPQSVLTLLATGENGLGVVNVRGALGVRVTTGPPFVMPTYSPLTNGVEVMVTPPGTITLQQGFEPPAGQKVELGLTGITVNAGGLPVTIESATLIELKAAGGVSKIVISPEGVQITGPTVRITGTVDTSIMGTRTSVTGAAELALKSPLTRIDPA